MSDKKTLRSEVLARRDALAWDQVKEKSRQIKERLFTLPEYLTSQTVMFFINFGKEVATLPMVKDALLQGKRVIVPKTVHKNRQMILSVLHDPEADLAPGVWGILEPKPEALRPVLPADISLVIVPGVAFSERGERLGYGGGYYDRFFTLMRSDVPLVALAYELQILPQVYTEPWDHAVDFIITEGRLINCKAK